MLEKKSNSIAERHKAEGNAKYKASKFKDALKSYNKALCYAVSDDMLSALYGNRSAVYFVLKKYKECLENIQKAKAHNYPTSKIQKIIEREEKCKELVEGQVKDEEKIKDFLKLTHPPNPKVPFIADCLELRYTKEFGRGIYATSDLKVGDIIAIEKTLFPSVSSEGLSSCCVLCLKINQLNLIPCLKCASFMFCSEECRDKAYEMFPIIELLLPGDAAFGDIRIFAQIEHAFGGPEGVGRFVTENQDNKWKETVFDLDYTDPREEDKNNVLALLSLMTDTSQAQINKLSNRLSQIKLLAGGNKLLQKFWEHAITVKNKNNTDYSSPSYGYNISGIYIFGSLMNHSCWPNVRFVSLNGKNVHMILKPIKAGEQLFFSYLSKNHLLSRDERHSIINETHYLTCHCYLCENNLDVASLPNIEASFMIYKLMRIKLCSLTNQDDIKAENVLKLIDFLELIRATDFNTIDDYSKMAFHFQRDLVYSHEIICTAVEFPC